MPRIPTVRAMVSRGFTPEQSKRIRELMKRHHERFLFRTPRPTNTLGAISEIIGGFGYESIPADDRGRHGEIHYVNRGDTYETTIIFHRGRFSIGAWGDIAERAL